VGICLKHLSQDPGQRHHSGNVPWQRVINSKGIISPRCVRVAYSFISKNLIFSSLESGILHGTKLCYTLNINAEANETCYRSQPSGARNQAVALRAEGVTVTTDALGELSVDFAKYGWFPKVLPSEEADEEQDWSSEDDTT